MLLKILMVLCYHSFVICQVNSSGVIKPPNREKDLCVSDNCLSKCCPKGMVYKKIPKKKSVCVIGDDSILNHKQKVHQELWFVDSVYLKDTNDILYGVPCHKKHIVNHPFYLQQVSYRYQIGLFLCKYIMLPQFLVIKFESVLFITNFFFYLENI